MCDGIARQLEEDQRETIPSQLAQTHCSTTLC